MQLGARWSENKYLKIRNKQTKFLLDSKISALRLKTIINPSDRYFYYTDFQEPCLGLLPQLLLKQISKFI